jgi:large subunit ribosomal protein L21
MSVVVQFGSKQYVVEPGQKFAVDRLPYAQGSEIDLPVIFRFGPETNTKNIKATVLAHEKGPKLYVEKYKNKTKYHRKHGHRSRLTILQVLPVKDSPKTEDQTEPTTANEDTAEN